MKKITLIFALVVCWLNATWAQQPVPVKPRIIISTDIGGTDPDDNQSFAHFLMYSDCFDTEGLISSPSYGSGNKEEMLRMVDLYEKDLSKLHQQKLGLVAPDSLRAIIKQGRWGRSPYCGYSTPTEGSEWIVTCARRTSDRPLWILVWGGLDDVAQALHDAPDIADRIRVYWIGGPNKKWSVYSYEYIVTHFPNLWFIENNSSYRGFIGDTKVKDIFNAGYYDAFIRDAGYLGKDYAKYYKGQSKLGDTPSLLYMMEATRTTHIKNRGAAVSVKSRILPAPCSTAPPRQTTLSKCAPSWSSASKAPLQMCRPTRPASRWTSVTRNGRAITWETASTPCATPLTIPAPWHTLLHRPSPASRHRLAPSP